MKTIFRCSLTVDAIKCQTGEASYAILRTIPEQILECILISYGVEFVHDRGGVGLGLLERKGLR